LLQRRHTPLTASLILGALWGIWHAPAWLLSGSEQAAWSFPVFFVGVLAIAVIVTPMFNAAGGASSWRRCSTSRSTTPFGPTRSRGTLSST
jgi:membrane protease YdiL (CAAX protease family)